MFILSEGLTRTGIANILGAQVLRVAGRREVPLIAVLMLTSGFLSFFMNNIGVAALMLPVAMEISRRTDTPPSVLLMPMAFGTLLGRLDHAGGHPAQPADQRRPGAGRRDALSRCSTISVWAWGRFWPASPS